MPALRLAEEILGHEHAIYISTDLDLVISPAPDGHVHQIKADESGVFYLEEAATATGEMHSHDLVAFPMPSKSVSKTDEELLDEVYDKFLRSFDYEEEDRLKGEESWQFVVGDQWDAATRAKRDELDKTTWQLNLIQKYVKILVGTQRQHRADAIALPAEGGDSDKARLLTALIKSELERQNYIAEESQIFEDVVVPGRGVFSVILDTSERAEGDARIEYHPWNDIYFGPHRRPDLRDCEYVFKPKWVSLDNLKSLYPDNAEGLANDAFNSNLPQDYPKDITGEFYTHDIGEERVRLYEYQVKRYANEYVIINEIDQIEQTAKGLSKKHADLIKLLPGFRVIKKSVRTIDVVKFAGMQILDKFVSPLSDFNVVPAYCWKKGDHFLGLVDPAKDPQVGYNHLRSQMQDILSASIRAYGVEDDAFSDGARGMNQFRENATIPGTIIELKEGGLNKIREFNGVSVPSDMVALSQMAAAEVKEIMNVRDKDVNPSRLSGPSLMHSKKEELTGQEILFDNFAIAKQKAVKLMLELILQFYTPRRIERLLMSRAEDGTLEFEGQIVTPEQIKSTLELWTDPNILDYDIKISESAYSPTNRLTNFTIIQEAAASGIIEPAIAGPLLMEYANIPAKKRIMAERKALQEQQVQLDSNESQTEVQKTQIAAESKLLVEQMKAQTKIILEQMKKNEGRELT
jgi:hypothetical protein